MDAAEITFGIEIECNLPAAVLDERGIVAGGYHSGRQVPGLPEGWNAQCDSSVRASRGRRAMEIVSPKLQGPAGLAQVRDVVATLVQWGARVNASCGFHVHVGWGLPQDELRRLVNLVPNLERGIYAATGTQNRERGGYCRPIREAYRRIDWARARLCPPGRYHLLNLTNLIGGVRPAVEFRAFSGTLNFKKIAAYIRLCVGLVQRASTSKAVVNYNPPAVDKGRKLYKGRGDGQCEMIRLLYGLGWFKGDQKVQWGALTGERLPSIDNSASVLMALAVKYDGPAAVTPPAPAATPAPAITPQDEAARPLPGEPGWTAGH